MAERELYKKAKKRVKAKKGFYYHIAWYAIVIFIFFLLNYFLIGTDEPWFIFPAMGWGIAVVIHFISVFAFQLRLDENWEQKEVEKEMRRLDSKNSHKKKDHLELPDDELDLREFDKQRKTWDDRDFV